jgi:chromosome partitioning protein
MGTDGTPDGARAAATLLAVANQKGGVGKTTTALNLGAALAAHGRRVLLVDMDPQGALSVSLGVTPATERTVYPVLLGRAALAEVVAPTGIEGIDPAPATLDLAGAEMELIRGPGLWQFALQERLAPALAGCAYDYVLFDCPPSLGVLTYLGLVAARGVLVPVQCEYLAWRGMQLLFETLERVRHPRLNPALTVAGILPTMYDARTLHAREALDELRRRYGALVCEPPVRESRYSPLLRI